MDLTLSITKAAHLKALALARAQYNEQRKAAAEAYNANLPKLFTGSGGVAQPHPDAVPIPAPLSETEHAVVAAMEFLDQLARQLDTDESVIDAQIAALEERRAKMRGTGV